MSKMLDLPKEVQFHVYKRRPLTTVRTALLASLFFLVKKDLHFDICLIQGKSRGPMRPEVLFFVPSCSVVVHETEAMGSLFGSSGTL
jgi:hypothetical protein